MRGWGFSARGWRGWEALAAAANAIFKPSVAMPAGAARSEVGSQPSVLRGKVFGVSSRGLTLCFPAVGAACLSQSSPRWENVAFAKQKVSVTGVLDESSLPAASWRSRKGCWSCWSWERAVPAACSDPRTWAASSRSAQQIPS